MSKRGFSMIPNHVLQNRDLSIYAKVAYLIISHYMSDPDDLAWPSHKTMADTAGASVSSMRRALEELREAGIIEVEARFDGARQTSNAYRLTPSGWAGIDIAAGSSDRTPPLSSQNTPPVLTEQRIRTNEQEPMNNNLGRTKRGTKLPDDWQPSAELVRWAADKGVPAAFGRTETERFCRYWWSKSRDNTKLDWGMTWQNWIDKAWSEEQRRGRPRDFQAEREAQTAQRVTARRSPLAAAL